MKTRVVLTLFGLMLSGAAFAQQGIVDQFEKRTLTREGLTLPYRLFVPAEYDTTVSYPLILALHGAGERGTDNERQIALHRLATSWADPANQAINPAFVVAPQVPPDKRWTAELPVAQSSFIDVQLTTLAILDLLQREFNIDLNRVYITGLSMGGHGTWDFVSRLPHRFAAAVPMSGNADPTQAEKLMHLPIWAFHGESDTVVRPFSARGIVQGMEDLGREVVYTDCRRSPVTATNFDCPPTMPNSVLSDEIDSHAHLIFTSIPNGGHGPWAVWYDHPLLADWVFSKTRVDPHAIAIDAPSTGDVWIGVETVNWTATGPGTDTVEVWLRLDERPWEHVGDALAGAGAFSLDTEEHPDAGRARLRLIVKNEHGRVYGRHTSGPFRIDNSGDGTPFLFLDDEGLRFKPNVASETLNLSLLVSDPEGDAVSADIFYSIDEGSVYSHVTTRELPASQDPQIVSLDLTGLPNSRAARIRVDVSDGSNVVSATTATFAKRTPRIVNDYVERVAGDGIGSITLHFIDPAGLTGHRYRITIDDSDRNAKTYSVDDMDLNSSVLTDVPLSDGVLESPAFDGMALVVEDLAVGAPNLEKTGWIAGDTDLGVSITGGSVLIAVLRVQLLETETEYELIISDSVADTSVAGFGLPSRPLYFRVVGRSDGLKRKLLFRDQARDGRIGNRDVLHILEPDSDGELAPAWQLEFSSGTDTVPPEDGDTFLFVPLYKLSSADVFEFIAVEGVSVEDPAGAEEPGPLHAYPNPFVDSVTIAYRLETPSHVRMDAFDLLGRRVALLYDGSVAAGDHRVTWNGHWRNGPAAASGLYVVVMTVNPDGGLPRWTARRAVTYVK